MVTKLLGVGPLTLVFGLRERTSTDTALLMSTGLTFGMISALFGLSNGIIDRTQYSALVTAAIASALVPTWIAQTSFLPHAPADTSVPLPGVETELVAERAVQEEGRAMDRTILVVFDGSPGAQAALRHAIELAHLFGAELWSLSDIEIPQWGTATVAEIDEQRRIVE